MARKVVGALTAALLLSLLPPAPAQASFDQGPLFETLDGAGDLHPNVPEAPSVVGGPGLDSADLRAFRVVEDVPEHFVFEIEVERLQPAYPEQADFVVGFRSVGATFSIDKGSRQFCVTGNFAPAYPGYGFGGTWTGWFGDFSGRDSYCSGRFIPIEVRPDSNTLRWTIPKIFFLAHGQKPSMFMGPPSSAKAKLPTTLDAGSKLTDIGLFGKVGSPSWLFDDGPDAGQPREYTIRTDAANSKIWLRSPYKDVDLTGAIAVDLGGTGRVPLTLANLMPGKRLVNLSAELVDPAAASKWSLRIPDVVEVPGAQERTINLAINASQGLQYAEQAVVLVKGQSLAPPDEWGIERLTLVASQAPSKERNVLHLHGASRGSEPGIMTSYSRAWMNTLDSDPRGTADESGLRLNFFLRIGGPGTGAGATLYVPLDTPLASATFLDGSRPLKLTLTLNNPVDLACSITAKLQIGHELIGQTSKAITLGPAKSATEFDLPIDPAFVRVSPAQGRPVLMLEVASDDPSAHFFYLGPQGPTLYPSESRMEWPILDRAEELQSADVFVAGLYASETQDFVNPGKTRLFNVTVVNQGRAADEFLIDATPPAGGWRVELKPSNRFRLGPGESALVGVLATAPADGAEGARGDFNISAAPASDPGSRQHLALSLILTHGITMRDDAGAYRADADSLQKVVVPPSKKSPDAALGALIAMAVALLVRRRAPT